MKKIVSIALIAVFNFGIISCSCSQSKFDTSKASSNEITNTLNNTSWSLKRLDVENRDFVPTEGQSELVLSFIDNRFGTNDGCNGQGGDFNVSDNKISFDKGIGTMRWCGEEMKHLIYRVPFGDVKSISIKKDQLQLLNKDKVVVATYIKKK